MSITPRQELKFSLHAPFTGLPLVRLGGVLWITKAIPLQMHRNPGYEITHLLSGRVTWLMANGSPLTLTGGDMAITQPGVEHRGALEVIEPCRLLWFVLDPTALDAATRTPFSAAELRDMDAVLQQAGNRVIKAGTEMRSVHLRLAECAVAAQHAEAGAVPPLLLQQIRVHLLRAFLSSLETLSNNAPAQAKSHPQVLQALAWMTAHLEGRNAGGVPALARHLGVSTSYLQALFKRHYGQSPADCFARMRLERAKSLLADSALPVTAIAMTLGYSSSQYFANCFTRYMGMTPTAYRRHPAPL